MEGPARAATVLVLSGLVLLGGLGLLPSAPVASTARESRGGPTGAPSPTWVAPAYIPTPGVREVAPLGSPGVLSVLVGLPPQDVAGMRALEDALYAPGTPTYRTFLTAAEFAQRFGATPATVSAAAGYFESFGLTASVTPDHLLLVVSGSAGAMGRAFDTSFATYLGPGGTTFVSHPTPARLPSGPWTGAFGLGDSSPLRPLAAAFAPGGPLPTPAGPLAVCSRGSGGLVPCQIYGAYNMSGLLSRGTNGTGVRLAVVDTYDSSETENQLKSDLSTFDTSTGTPAAPSVTYAYPVPTSQNLNSSTSSGWGLEEALDLEWSHAAAPAASLTMTFAPNSGVGLYEAVDYLVAHQLADVISLSWGEPDVGVYNSYAGACASACNASTDGSYGLLSPVLSAAALEGIGVFVASGDCGSSDGTGGVSTDYPSSDPSVTGVGGTVLNVSGATYLSEFAWSGNHNGNVAPGCQNQGGSGGGYAPFPRPYWQTGTGLPSSPSTRGDPDVALDAATAAEVVVGGGTSGVGGTSLATPIWAGIAALADNASGHPLGLLTPSIYAILRGTHYASDFHDITAGGNGAYTARTGWDPVTGVGTPIVTALVGDLASPSLATSDLRTLLSASPGAGPLPLSVTFALNTTGGTGTYPLEDVTFGDGTAGIASGGVVRHTYLRAGPYTALAFAADSSGNSTVSAPVVILAGSGTHLAVALNASLPNPGVDASEGFSASVSGGSAPYQYFFAFGDGTYVNFSASASVTHAYGAAGTYCAAVVVQDSASNSGASAALAIPVGGSSGPSCGPASAPLKVTSLPAPAARDAPADFPALFSVSAPSNATVTEQYSASDPYVGACGCTIFRTPGNYSVTLNASDGPGQWAVNSTTVSVAPPLQGTFGASPRYGVGPLTVQFSASATGGVAANASGTVWAFGDGSGALGASVSHVYTSPGSYFATADLEDRGHGNVSEGFVIDVLTPAPNAIAYTATMTPAVNASSGSTARLEAWANHPNGTSAPGTFLWAVANGSAFAVGANVAETVYVPLAGGFALAYSLEVATGAGTAQPVAGLYAPSYFANEAGSFTPRADALYLSASGGPTQGYAPANWTGTGLITNPGASYLNWSFGDGVQYSGTAAAHPYPRAGNFTIFANGSDSWGDRAVVTLGAALWAPAFAPLVVSAAASPTRGTAPLTVRFSAAANSGDAPYSYDWEFGDGAHASTASAPHTYGAAGTYVANLTVLDGSAHSFRENWTVVVLPSAGTPFGTSLVVVVLAAGLTAGLLAVGLLVARRRRRGPGPLSL